MKEREYRREKAVEYAHKWAYRRNPSYYNFDPVGGDCTSFASQCIYQGCQMMNYEKQNGWYYTNGNDKAPSWSGVPYLYQFLTTNQKVGPYGREVEKEQIQIGDIAQLSFDGENYTHTLNIIEVTEPKSLQNILVATHTFDSDYRKISSYSFEKIRWIHIQGVRIW